MVIKEVVEDGVFAGSFAARLWTEFKEKILEPGDWTLSLDGFGECLPYHENKMTLDYKKLDELGLPTVTFDAEWKENE